MPLAKSSSKKATEANFHEFRHGRTFQKTAAKFGKEKARKQMVAAVLSNKRKYEKKGSGTKVNRRKSGKPGSARRGTFKRQGK